MAELQHSTTQPIYRGILLIIVAIALATLLIFWILVLLIFFAPLSARWCEPVLRQPVLIIESDDWGAGPLIQADALNHLIRLLEGVRDCSNRAAVMTLGIVFEVPDGTRIIATSPPIYHALSLTDARYHDVRFAIQRGIQAGVLIPQLHGQCHYWPPALMAVALTDDKVRNWLTTPEPASTEDLPSHLQSRWIDATSLPSKALESDALSLAIAIEVATYQAVFNSVPQVAVATTFIWTPAVEAAWAKAGIEIIITPGRRYSYRNAEGKPDGVAAEILSGQRSTAGQTYLVRDVYFEPTQGHLSQRLVDGLLTQTRLGRACLVETHRYNFLQAQATSLAALEHGLKAALLACPTLRFLSPLELAHALQTHDPEWIETRLNRRLSVWCARLHEIPRFRRVTQACGLALVLTLLEQSL
jgi:hypothetical protein